MAPKVVNEREEADLQVGGVGRTGRGGQMVMMAGGSDDLGDMRKHGVALKTCRNPRPQVA
jgi:hypothetical protein